MLVDAVLSSTRPVISRPRITGTTSLEVESGPLGDGREILGAVEEGVDPDLRGRQAGPVGVSAPRRLPAIDQAAPAVEVVRPARKRDAPRRPGPAGSIWSGKRLEHRRQRRVGLERELARLAGQAPSR